MKRSVQEDAETEDFATKDMSVNVQMDFMGLTVRKVILNFFFNCCLYHNFNKTVATAL